MFFFYNEHYAQPSNWRINLFGYLLFRKKERNIPKPEIRNLYEDVSKSSRTGRLERELQMVQLSATKCSYIAIL